MHDYQTSSFLCSSVNLLKFILESLITVIFPFRKEMSQIKKLPIIWDVAVCDLKLGEPLDFNPFLFF